MPLVPRDLELSRKRAPCRDLVLVFLASVEEASLHEIAEATNIRASRVVGLLEGRCCEYAEDLSLVRLGAARRVATEDARRWRVTALGRVAAERAAERWG